MKKIISILLSVMVTGILLAGCGNKEEKNNESIIKAVGTENVSGGVLYDDITSIYKNVDVEYISKDDKVDGEKNLLIKIKLDNDKNTKSLSDEFNKISKEIFDKIQSTAINYKNLYDINFSALVNNKECESATILCIRYVKDDGKVYYEFGSQTEAKDFKEKEEKPTNYIENHNNEVEKNNQIVEVPDEEGNFNASKLLDNIQEGDSGLSKTKSSFELINKDNKKIVKVNLIYKNKVLIVGRVKNIRNNIESAFKDQCDEIDLTITQEHPMDVYECKYIDGSWDKEVNNI